MRKTGDAAHDVPEPHAPVSAEAGRGGRRGRRDALRCAGLALVVAAVGVALMVPGTRWGAGLSTDSVHYLYAARSVAAGGGFFVLPDDDHIPMTHFPPLYPLTLAAAGRFLGWGWEPATVGRWLNVALLPVNLLLIMAAVRRVVAQRWVAPVAGVLALTCLAVARAHLMLWSEPLFLALTLAGLLAVARGLGRPSPIGLVVGAGLLGLAGGTRYAGAAGAAMLPVAVWLWAPPAWSRARRVVTALVVGAIAAAPLAAWSLRNALAVGNPANRHLAFHPPGASHLRSAAATVTEWVLPETFPLAVRLAVVGALVLAASVVAVRMLRRRRGDAGAEPGAGCAVPAVLRVMILYALCYVGLLLVSLTFVDAYTRLDDRILLPLYPVALVAAFWLAGRVAAGGSTRRVWGTVAVGCAAVVVLGAVQVSEWHAVAREHGLGYARRSWQAARVVRAIERTPGRVPIYTNAQPAIYAATGRVTRPIPIERIHSTGLPSSDFERNMEAVERNLRERRGVVILVRRFGAPANPSEAYLRKRLRLRSTYDDGDAVIYRMEPPASAPGSAPTTGPAPSRARASEPRPATAPRSGS